MLNEILIVIAGISIILLVLSLLFIILNRRFEKIEDIPVSNLSLGIIVLFLVVFGIDILRFLLLRFNVLNEYIGWVNHEYIGYFISLGILPLLFIFYVVMILYVREIQKI